MRKSGWAAAAGLGSLVLLLTACGGSSGSSSTSSSTPTTTAQATGGQPSSDALSAPPPGSVVLIVQKSALGYVLAEANGQVLYTYAKDSKGGAPTCTGSCAAAWPPVTGTPKAGPADTFPGQFGVVKGAGGVEQITYNGYPLYAFKGAKPLSTAGNGIGGVWHVVPLSASDISGA